MFTECPQIFEYIMHNIVYYNVYLRLLPAEMCVIYTNWSLYGSGRCRDLLNIKKIMM